MGVYLMGLRLIGMYLVGMYLTGLHLRRVPHGHTTHETPLYDCKSDDVGKFSLVPKLSCLAVRYYKR
jgi:hypothetical protein